jgi:hypothetical protein
MIQTAPPATAAPINAQAHPGRPLDSEDGSLFAAAAAAAAAAGAWPVEVEVEVVVGVVTVCVWTTVFVCVGAVTVFVFGGAVTVLALVTVFVSDGAVLVVVEVVGAAAIVAGFVCAAAVAVWSWEAWGSVLACAAVGVLLPVLAVTPSARLEAV